MKTTIMRRPAPTEPCGACRTPVDTSSRYAVRSRFTGKPLCDRHSTADAAEHLDVRTTVAAPRYTPEPTGTRATFDAGFEPCVHCGDTMLVTMLSARSLRSNSPVCEPCATGAYRDEVRRPQPVTPARAWAYTERALEAWRARTPEMIEEAEALARGASPYASEFRAQRTAAAETPWETRHQYDEDDESDDDGYEARVLRFDGETAVYGPEPDGEPVAGRTYETRWWAADSASEMRDRVADVEWVLR